MKGRLDQHTTLAELPDLINASVAMMMSQVRDLLTEYDLTKMPPEKIRAKLAALEQQIRSAEEERLRTAWLSLRQGEIQ